MTRAMLSAPFTSNTIDIILHLKGEAAKGAARLRAYDSWSLENHAPMKGNIKAHATISNEFMADLDIPPNSRGTALNDEPGAKI
jgi:hypothetical protein